ncbi:MAG: tetratricopeptide repeat protein [Pseudomonadota bacterium]
MKSRTAGDVLLRGGRLALIVGMALWALPVPHGYGRAGAATAVPWKGIGLWLKSELPKDVVAALIAEGVVAGGQATWERWVGRKPPATPPPAPMPQPVLPPVPTPPEAARPYQLPSQAPSQTRPPPGASWRDWVARPAPGANELINRGSGSAPPLPAAPPAERCLGQALTVREAFERGYRHDLGTTGGARNPLRARECYELAAGRGSLYAAYLLAHSYLYDAPADVGQGLRWLTRAANRGLVYAQVELGDLYHPWEGIRPDRDEALRWYGAAAGQRVGYAAYRLALIHADSPEAGDQVLAFQWLRQALLDGYQPALEEMRQRLDRYYPHAVGERRPEFLYLFGLANDFGVPQLVWPRPWDAGAFYCAAARQGYRPAQAAFTELRRRYPRLPYC